jgi:hypothetical protein
MTLIQRLAKFRVVGVKVWFSAPTTCTPPPATAGASRNSGRIRISIRHPTHITWDSMTSLLQLHLRPVSDLPSCSLA